MVLVEPRRVIGYSPLRYPGGKSSLTDFLARAIDHNFQADVRYVEPYAGGAGAAVALLLQGRVGSIIINDFDPAIWAIWHSIVNDSQSFLKLIRETPVSLDEWKMQRSIYQAGNAADPLSLGFASFFLNRTNRSGVMNAGAIGGKAQDGNYRIDARYNKPALIHMVQKIAERQSSITVRNEDGLELIREVREDSGTFIYADPPYFEKGSFLYMNSFTSSQHEELAKSSTRIVGNRSFLFTTRLIAQAS
jgi:DNA adenine methylase